MDPDSIIGRLTGLPIELAELGHGSFLTFRLGRLIEGEEPMREWLVWIFCCYWEMYKDGSLVSHCEDDKFSMASSVDVLGGCSVSRITVESDGSSEFVFSDGTILQTTPWQEEATSWMIFTPDRTTLSFESDGTWGFTPHDP